MHLDIVSIAKESDLDALQNSKLCQARINEKMDYIDTFYNIPYLRKKDDS